jgi:hypothetical protein
MSMLLTFLFTCLAFSVSVSLDFPCPAHVILSERLFNHFQGLRRTFSEISIKSVGSIAKYHQARYKIPNKMT